VSSLLDANICIAWLKGGNEQLRRRLLGSQPGDVFLCSIVKAELLFGARKSKRVAENLRRLDEFFAAFPSVSFTDDAASHYGLARAQLEEAGTPIGPHDLLIASIALANDMTVVTRNDEEFSRVAGLRVEVW
jgi:tRNA(fMet)-specific endonuclease VapC